MTNSRLLRTLCFGVGILAVAAQVPGSCDPAYDCVYLFRDMFGVVYEFDFRPLCTTGGYEILDPNNHTYSFNICGLSAATCTPKDYTSRFSVAPAVQYWGDTPSCNDTNPECTDPLTGLATCCTPTCEALGSGSPLWSVQDPLNAATGGVNLTYTGVPPEPNDPNLCQYNVKTSAQASRAVTFMINCDPSVTNGIAIDSVGEPSQCQYVIALRTAAACGCAPQCQGKFCGSDGCNGYCSGDSLAGSCPWPQTCTTSGICCRPDCDQRDCGDDGCGGSCGACGADETCGSSSTCVSTIPYIPSSTITYAPNQSGLAGAFFGGIVSAVAAAGAFMFATGPGRKYFQQYVQGGKGSGSSGSSGPKDNQALFGSGSNGSSSSRGGGYGGLGASARGGGYGSTASTTTVSASGAISTEL